MSLLIPIKSVYCAPPRLDGEEADGASVGYKGVTSIIRREENCGMYSLIWYDVYRDDVPFKSFQAANVESVYYMEPEEIK